MRLAFLDAVCASNLSLFSANATQAAIITFSATRTISVIGVDDGLGFGIGFPSPLTEFSSGNG